VRGGWLTARASIVCTMRNVVAATLTVVAGLVVANMLGVAAAEAPTATPTRTISVEGVATVAIAQGANLATATMIYRGGMAAAVTDGQGKAEFLASKAGATLGAVQDIAEGGGSIECTGGEEGAYVAYQGEQPDFGSAESVSPLRAAVAPAAPGLRKPVAKHRRKKVTSPTAKKATATTCTLTTQVSLVYAIA
jgi:hypothetical protein